MCLPKNPRFPATVVSDPVADQAKIDAQATNIANAQVADRKRSTRTSVLSTGAQYSSDGATATTRAIGKDTFGG